MTKTKTLIMAGAIAALGLAGLAYAEDANILNPNLQKAVEEGVVDQQTAEKLQTYNREQRQAQMRENVDERISQAVEEGTITEDEAQQIRDWQNSRPEAMSKMRGLRKGKMGGNGMGYGGNCPMANSDTQDN